MVSLAPKPGERAHHRLPLVGPVPGPWQATSLGMLKVPCTLRALPKELTWLARLVVIQSVIPLRKKKTQTSGVIADDREGNGATTHTPLTLVGR